MGNDPVSLTSPTLLGRLCRDGNDEAAWGDFVARYGPLIRAWCLRWSLQEADAEDVTQDVLLRLAGKLRTFVYDPSRRFRGWLRTLTHHALADFAASRKRLDSGSGDSQTLEALHSVAARTDLLDRLEEQFDRELLEEAMARVRLRVQPQTWEAFRLTALEGLSGEDAARQTGLRLTAVFKAKSRVQQLLREEITRLEQGPSP
jgi:RNA polymerase sigma-70 factor (ECF subfamily)